MEQSSKRILVVEDDTLVRRSFVRMMEVEKYQVYGAASCAEGLKKLHRSRFDLILTDIRLGDESGMKILERAKKINPNIIVFMVTGYSSLESMKKAMKNGASDYIVKPVDMDLLLLKIKTALERVPRPSDQSPESTSI